jgi:hypothetical protein
MSTLLVGPDGLPYWDKDPTAEKDYIVDWTTWLAGDTVSAYVVTVQNGLTKIADQRAGAVVTTWLGGGTRGKDYKVTVRVTTAGGRIDERSFIIRVREQ